LHRVTPVKIPTKEEEIIIDKLKYMSKMLTKKTMELKNLEDKNQNHHTPVNRLGNSNIKADLVSLEILLMLEQLLVNSQT
jgi:hypothetical protein